MIVDTSVLIAILFGEEDAASLVEIIRTADIVRLSIVSHLELIMVIEGQLGTEGVRHTDTFIERSGIQIEPVTIEQGSAARQAFLDFGKGRHEAQLNLGDCFAYALAKVSFEPLLFKDDSFHHTDAESVLPRIIQPNVKP